MGNDTNGQHGDLIMPLVHQNEVWI